MICNKCGREIADGAKFCTYCGATAGAAAEGDVGDVGAVVNAVDAGAVVGAAGTMAEGTAEQPSYGEALPSGFDAPPPVIGEIAAPAYDAPPPGPGAAEQPMPYGAPLPPPAYGAAQQPAPYEAQPVPYDAPPVPYGANDAPPAPPASPYGAQPAVPLGSPQMMYGAAPAPQTQKKSRAGLVVGIIIAAVLVLGVAVAIGGYFIYQNVVANVPDPTIPKITDPGTKPDTNPDTNPGPSTVTPPTPNNPPASKPLVDDFKNPYVVLDEAEIKITIDVGSGTTENAGGYYDVYCVVENKTDREFSIYLEEVSGDGYLGDSGNVYIFPDFYDYSSLWDFAPGECLSIFSFQTDEVDGKVTKFKAKLVVFDANSYEDVCEYYIEIPEL